MFKRIFILSLFLFIIVAGCKKNSATPTAGVPNVAVNFNGNIYGALYTNLITVGGWGNYSGGYLGIILFRSSPDIILAFDRGCPYDCETNAKAFVNVQTNGITAVCPVCGTTYNLYSGTVTKGRGSIALKQYTVNFDESTGDFTVSN